jgi:hypothetical protein
MKNLRVWCVLVLLPVLAACGGGGGASGCKLLGDALCDSPNPVVNLAPVALAGTNQSVLLGVGSVLLDGSGSTDADGNANAYGNAEDLHADENREIKETRQ